MSDDDNNYDSSENEESDDGDSESEENDDEDNGNEGNDFEFDFDDEETVIQRTIQLLESTSVTPLQLERLHEKKLITLRKRIPKPERMGAPDHVVSPLWSKCLFMQCSVTEEGLEEYTSLGATEQNMLRGIHQVIANDYLVVCVTCMSDPNKPLKDCLHNASRRFVTTHCYKHLESAHSELLDTIRSERTVLQSRFRRPATGDNAAAAPTLRDDNAVEDDNNAGDDRAATKRQKVSNNIGSVRSAIRVNDLIAFRAAAREMENIIARARADGSRVAFSSMMIGILERTNKIVAVLKRNFEGAMLISEVWKTVVEPVATKYGITLTNTCFAQSICHENVIMAMNNNNQQKQRQSTTTITDRFIQYLAPEQQKRPQVYSLGGLAGIPFAGSTGFKIFSRHVPTTSSTENGDGGCHHAFVLQASHIGMASDATLGAYTHNSNGGGPNDGSQSSSNVVCCEAAVGAFSRCCAVRMPIPVRESEHDSNAHEHDIHMAFLTREISKKVNIIMASEGDAANDNARQAELARQTHCIGKSMLDKIVSTNFGDEESLLFVLTGIQINMPYEFEEDYFQPKSFVIYRKDGSIIDLLAEESSFDNNDNTIYF